MYTVLACMHIVHPSPPQYASSLLMYQHLPHVKVQHPSVSGWRDERCACASVREAQVLGRVRPALDHGLVEDPEPDLLHRLLTAREI